MVTVSWPNHVISVIGNKKYKYKIRHNNFDKEFIEFRWLIRDSYGSKCFLKNESGEAISDYPDVECLANGDTWLPERYLSIKRPSDSEQTDPLTPTDSSETQMSYQLFSQ